MRRRSRGRCRPSFAKDFRPSKDRGRREDRVSTDTRGPRADKNARGRNHRLSRNTRPSLRDGLTAYAVLSREPNSFWPPSPRRLAMRLTRLGAPHLREKLGRSDDGQDHTVLPSALSAVRLRVAADSQGLPALPAPLVPTLPRPPQARLAISDDVRSPLKDEPGCRDTYAISEFR